MKKALFTALAVCFTAQLALASGPVKMIRLELTETKSGQPTDVKLTLPFNMIRTLAPQIQESINNAKFEHHDIDFREIWREVRDAGPNHYVEITQEDEIVNVSTTETHLLFDIVSKKEGKINVSVPLVLGDILFAQELPIDVEAALAELEALEGQDLVKVTGDQINLRVWIETR